MHKRSLLVIAIVMVGTLARSEDTSLSAQDEFKGDTEGRALYDTMVTTMHDARSLYLESEYQWESQGKELGHATYRIWLKKPNQFRMEASKFGSDTGGVLVGDGENLWIYWPEGKPRYGWEESGEYAKQYEKTRLTSYMKRPTPQGKHSIAHRAPYLGVDRGTAACSGDKSLTPPRICLSNCTTLFQEIVR
jgi:hypothetical protein